MMRWIILFSWFSFSPLFLLYCCLLPQLMLELVMLWCFVCFGWGYSAFAFVWYKFIQFLLHSGITDARGETGRFSFISMVMVFSSFFFVCFLFLFRIGYKRVWGKAFTRLIFVGSFLPLSFQRTENKSTSPEIIQ